MHVRPYTFLDYPTVKEWADKRSYPLFPTGCLSQTGLIIDGYCAGFLFRTDTNMCWLGPIISNPESDTDDRHRAIDLLLSEFVNLAKELKFEYIFASLVSKSLIERHKDAGFIVTDENVTHLLRRL